MSASTPTEGLAASRLIDLRIADLDDWRGQTLRRLRQLILQVEAQAFQALVRAAAALNAAAVPTQASRGAQAAPR